MKYKTIKTDYNSLANVLNSVGGNFTQIIPITEGDATLFVVVYIDWTEDRYGRKYDGRKETDR